jgi:hypothetical protein
MKNIKRIRGAGGGGGGKDGAGSQHVPTEAPDSLISKAYAQVIDLISEGEINGLVNGLKSIFLDGTPIQNPDGSLNFNDMMIQTRVGTQDQDFIVGFSDVENEIAVGTAVLAAVPIVRSLTNVNLDACRVTLSFPQLTYQDPSTGDLSGNTINVKIELQSNGAGYVEVVNDIIKGKSTSKYQKNYRIFLAGDPPWDIKVTKITADSIHAYDQKSVSWESYTEIEDVKMKYPNSALVGMRIDSSQFQNIPTRAFDIKGLRIKVPTNYDPVTRAYSGSWDGTFQIDWTDNPAWIFYDLVTSVRYGLGQFIPEDHVDKWSLYQIAQYCDELVADGFGGTEPRFACNLFIQTRADAYKVMQDMASAFRGMIYWASGTIAVAQDSPGDAMHLFTPANVIDGAFNYSGASAKARHTVALVTWNDPNDFYRQKVEYVEDSEAVANYGVVETSILAFGCTSRGQAHRAGKWILFTEKYQSETVAFQTGLQGAPVRPGQIIKVADPMRAGVRRGGRLLSTSTASILYVDSAVDVSAGDMVISIILPDGTVEDRAVDTISGNQIVPLTAFSQAPVAGAMWIAATGAVEAQEFRVLAITESKPGLFEITALAHSSVKFDSIDTDNILTAPSISALSSVPASPEGLQITETLYSVGVSVRVKVTCSWHKVSGAVGYNVQYQRDSQNPVVLGQTSSNEVEVLNAEPGIYTFYVTAVNSIGTPSVTSSITQTVQGLSAPPIDIQNFSMLPVGNQAYLSWDLATDLDVIIGGSVRIRYTPIVDTPVWKNGVDIVPALPGTATRAYAPLLTGSYMAKFIDADGNPSFDEAIIITTIPQALALNVVDSFSEDPAFGGVMTNMQFLGTYEGILLASAILFDDEADVDSEIVWDFPGGVAAEGEYDFANAVDLGAVYTSQITAALQVAAVDITDTWDERLNLMDAWRDIDGSFIDDVNAELYVRTTEDDPGGAPTWTDWKRFFVGQYRFRAAQFKLIATSSNTQHNINVTGISITIDMEDRTVAAQAITSGAGSYAVTFAEPFKTAPSIGITADGMNSGDYYRLTSKSETGFTITFYNSSNAAISKVFDYLAKGYGRKVA